MSELKLVEGKQYVYANKLKCKLVHWCEENKTWTSLVLYDDGDLPDELHHHDESGVCIFNQYNIVSEYVEPPKPMEIWVNHYRYSDGASFFGVAHDNKCAPDKIASTGFTKRTIHFREVTE